MQKEYLVPASILIGCGIIGAGLYFGLRSQSQPVAPLPAVSVTGAAPGADGPRGQAPPANVPPPGAPPPAQPGPAGDMPGVSPPTVAADLQATVEKAATEALAAEKKNKLVPKCWEPAIKANPQPPAAKFTLDMTFDGQGNQITLGISEQRSAARADVAKCLREENLSLRIQRPPGNPVRVVLPLDFP